jgi:hypothetical protein
VRRAKRVAALIEESRELEPAEHVATGPCDVIVLFADGFSSESLDVLAQISMTRSEGALAMLVTAEAHSAVRWAGVMELVADDASTWPAIDAIVRARRATPRHEDVVPSGPELPFTD